MLCILSEFCSLVKQIVDYLKLDGKDTIKSVVCITILVVIDYMILDKIIVCNATD